MATKKSKGLIPVNSLLEEYIFVSGYKIRFLEKGKGPTLILFHGLGGIGMVAVQTGCPFTEISLHYF